jgi:hypothetical protein
LTSNDICPRIGPERCELKGKGRVATVIWSNTAFNIYMGDALAQEPEASSDPEVMHADVLHAEATLDRDVMLAAAAHSSALEDAAACEAAIEARRGGALVTRGARG